LTSNPTPSLNKHIMLVEDDASLAEWIADYLNSQGYEVSVSNRGDEAVSLIKEDQPDLLILDISLPGMDGFDVCREVRPFYKHPILMMTARVEETDEVLGLELGADDYVTKPVRPRALLARIKGLLKRDTSDTVVEQEAPSDSMLEFGVLSIDLVSRTTVLDGNVISISSNEFDVLVYLATRAGQVISRDTLLKEIRGIDYDGFDRSMDLTVSRIRKKLLDEGTHSTRIKTVWGKGYLFVADAWEQL